MSIRRIFDGDESSALFDDDVSISFTESSNNHAAAESSSQWNTTLFAIWPVEMKKLEYFFVIILYVFPRENVDIGRTKSADKNKAEGVISKEMILTR